VTVSFTDVITVLVSTLAAVVQVRIVPGVKLLNVTVGGPGLTPVLTNPIPSLISEPIFSRVSSTTTDDPLYVKNGRKRDGILDGCDDGFELGTLDGFEEGILDGRDDGFALGTLDGFELGLELGD